MTEESKASRVSPLLAIVTTALVLIAAAVLAPWVGGEAAMVIIGGAALLTWVAVRASSVDVAGMHAAVARANAVGIWDSAIAATMIEGDRVTRGLLARHPDRIGFFPISSSEDLVIQRSAIHAIEGIVRDSHVGQLLRIQWLGSRIEERVFAAGSDLSPWTGEPAPEPPAPLPRASVKIRDEE